MTDTMQRSLFGEVESTTAAPSQAALFADVVFDRPLDHAYTYAVPDDLLDQVAVGKRVAVPFGKGDKTIPGYCVRLSPTGPERPVKVLKKVLDQETLLTPDLLRLTRWMADYYLCGWGQVLNAVVPAGARQQAGTRAAVFFEALPIAEGLPPKLSAQQTEALAQLRNAGAPIEARQLTRLAKCGPGPLAALVAKGLARRFIRREDTHTADPELGKHADAPRDEQSEPSLNLNVDQLRAWQTLEPALREGGFKPFLLYGVTGSGKTELYLRAIEEIIRQGKEVLVLVPEISLTPQTLQRFRGRCAGVAVMHSHLGNAERGQHWRRVAAGQVQVVVGARSAVFAPTRKLGLIIIDEEHESSFKQETTPRYHARDVAVMRARLENVPILLGSATPSLESWHNAERGHYTLLTLPSRVLERPLPKVSLLDLRHEERPRGKFQAVGLTLERAMRDALAAGGQVMLLLNRRGFSTHIHCPGCGHVAACKFCDLALTFHREREILLCHYCGYEQEPLVRCPQCSEQTVRYQGLGTEKLQTEVEERFPGYTVKRMDSDTMRKPGSHAAVLSAFRRGEIHILLGTQMIAKGLDFPNVTLVGVVNADIGLHLPDFRSAERTFQLLAQVAGRTGRGPRGGTVLIQTFTPDNPCIELAARHDYAGFVKTELVHRRAHNYPPFQLLARLIVRSKDQQAAGDFADKLAAIFADAMPRVRNSDGTPAMVRLLGPAETPVFRLKGYYRYHFQLQSPSAAVLHQLLRLVLPTLKPTAGVEWTVDVDPLNMQ